MGTKPLELRCVSVGTVWARVRCFPAFSSSILYYSIITYSVLRTLYVLSIAGSPSFRILPCIIRIRVYIYVIPKSSPSPKTTARTAANSRRTLHLPLHAMYIILECHPVTIDGNTTTFPGIRRQGLGNCSYPIAFCYLDLPLHPLLLLYRRRNWIFFTF